MKEIGIAGVIIIIINVIFSYKGFQDRSFFENYKFQIDKVLINRDYKRLITSGFLHVSWTHLIFNMISLYFFSGLLEGQLGILSYVLIYFSSLIGGDLLATFVHRNHGDYSAVGASGAVCGIIFASIALFPGLKIGLFLIPISIPSWIYGLLFVAYSIYGIKSGKDNIGHEAHLGGALIGMLVALIIKPSAISENYLIISLVVIPILIFIYFIITKPHFLYVDNYYFKTKKSVLNVDQKYNEAKVSKQKELDKILDKISKKGMNSLTKKERERLNNHSTEL